MMDEIVGEAAEILERIPPDAKVFITSSDLNRLTEMETEFHDYGIRDVVFITPTQIMNGALRGRIGVLLVKDVRFMSDDYRHCLFQEAELLKCTIGWH